MKPEKEFNVFVVDGTIFLEYHSEGSYHIGEMRNVDVNCLNDIADLLNKQYERINELEHQLSTLDGLYVSDKEDMSDSWRLNLKEIL